MLELDAVVGETLDTLAERLERQATSPTPDLARRLDALEALIPPDDERMSAHDAAVVVRRAERDHVAIARTLVQEVAPLHETIDSALAVRQRS
jgi:hypothetical protein